MPKRLAFVTVLASLLLLGSGCVFVGMDFDGKMRRVVVEESDRLIELNRIVLIDIDGFIRTGGSSWSFVPGTSVADVKEKLKRAAEDSRVVAVVLRINSPGGVVAATDTIYQEILKFKEKTEKPVVAMCMGVAASGGYYVACAADRIVAVPTCITGSIGVIMTFYNVEGLFYKIGLREQVIKSGRLKDIASATRKPTPEELKILRHINQTLFDRFRDAVKAGRPEMTEADIKKISDAQPVTAQEAKTYHMIDRIGYLSDAFAEARTLADVGGADVIMYRPHRSYNSNVYAGRPPPASALEKALEAIIRRRGPMMLYLWDPAR